MATSQFDFEAGFMKICGPGPENVKWVEKNDVIWYFLSQPNIFTW